MNEADTRAKLIDPKKLGEIDTVRKFIQNSGHAFDRNLVSVEVAEPADVRYGTKLFQVTKVPAWQQGLLGKAAGSGKPIVANRFGGPSAEWREYILEPLRKKSRYGKSANGIMFLIRSHFRPIWVEENLRVWRDLNLQGDLAELKALGFDEIHLVLPDKNLQIFP